MAEVAGVAGVAGRALRESTRSSRSFVLTLPSPPRDRSCHIHEITYPSRRELGYPGGQRLRHRSRRNITRPPVAARGAGFAGSPWPWQRGREKNH